MRTYAWLICGTYTLLCWELRTYSLGSQTYKNSLTHCRALTTDKTLFTTFKRQLYFPDRWVLVTQTSLPYLLSLTHTRLIVKSIPSTFLLLFSLASTHKWGLTTHLLLLTSNNRNYNMSSLLILAQGQHKLQWNGQRSVNYCLLISDRGKHPSSNF